MEADALHQAKAAAIQQLGHETMDAGQLGEGLMDLLAGEHGRQALGPFGADGSDGKVQILLKHFAVEEEQGIEGLVLGGSRDVEVYGLGG